MKEQPSDSRRPCVSIHLSCWAMTVMRIAMPLPGGGASPGGGGSASPDGTPGGTAVAGAAPPSPTRGAEPGSRPTGASGTWATSPRYVGARAPGGRACSRPGNPPRQGGSGAPRQFMRAGTGRRAPPLPPPLSPPRGAHAGGPSGSYSVAPQATRRNAAVAAYGAPHRPAWPPWSALAVRPARTRSACSFLHSRLNAATCWPRTKAGEPGVVLSVSSGPKSGA